MTNEPAETVIRDSSGHVLDRWVEPDDNDDPCCDECVAWRTGEDEQARQDALQDSINAALERLKMASIGYSLQQGVFVIGKPCTITPGCIKAEGHDSECTVLK